MASKRKPPMPGMLRPFTDEALKREHRRPASPGVAVESKDGRGWAFGAPHRDFAAWEVQIRDAFGTRSESACWTFLNQLAALCKHPWDGDLQDWRPSETELNAALNIVSGTRPRNEVEACLAAQMVAVHLLQMQTAEFALRTFGMIHHAAVAGKLARTFAMQCDTLNRLQGKAGKQHIKVTYERHDHKHVHIEEGGIEKGTQPRAPTRRVEGFQVVKHAPGATMQSPDKTRHGMPGTGGERKSPLSHARQR
jgi:hypothetical protein